MAISLLCFYSDTWYTVFKLYDIQMVTLKPFCVRDNNVAMTFHSAHTIYLLAMLVLKNGKRVYIQNNRLRLLTHHIT